MSVDKEEIEKVICSKCGGKGGVRGEWLCFKCLGGGKLDWIENVVGKRLSTIKPGVYTREVDLSSYVSERPYTPVKSNKGIIDRSKS